MFKIIKESNDNMFNNLIRTDNKTFKTKKEAFSEVLKLGSLFALFLLENEYKCSNIDVRPNGINVCDNYDGHEYGSLLIEQE